MPGGYEVAKRAGLAGLAGKFIVISILMKDIKTLYDTLLTSMI